MLLLLCFALKFMRPRARDKKLLEEWALSLKSLEDVYEVLFLTKSVKKVCYNVSD